MYFFKSAESFLSWFIFMNLRFPFKENNLTSLKKNKTVQKGRSALIFISLWHSSKVNGDLLHKIYKLIYDSSIFFFFWGFPALRKIELSCEFFKWTNRLLAGLYVWKQFWVQHKRCCCCIIILVSGRIFCLWNNFTHCPTHFLLM